MRASLIYKAVDALFGLAITVSDYLDERRKRKRERAERGLTYKDVKGIQDQITRATRSRAPTVILPKK